MGGARAEEALPLAGGRRPPAAARAALTAATAAAAHSTPSWPLPPAPPSARSPGSPPARDCRLLAPWLRLKAWGSVRGGDLLGDQPSPYSSRRKRVVPAPSDGVKEARES